MSIRSFYGEVSPENILKVTEKAGQEIVKVFNEEKNVTDINCSITLTPDSPMRYKIQFETFESIKALN